MAESSAPTGTFPGFMTEGTLLYRRGEYGKALACFNNALQLRAGDKHGLVARSRCYLKLGDTQSSLKDAEASLQSDKTFPEGLYQKAEALYTMGDFEFALVFYHRGCELRPELQKFRLGIQKSHEAIINCIGSPSSVKLKNKEDLCFISRQAESKKADQKLQIKLTKDQKCTKKKEPARNQKTERQLLGELYADKAYLEKLLKDEGFLHCFHLNVPSKQDLLSFFCILITTRVFLRAHIACSDSSVGERQMSAESRCLWSQIQYSELPLNVSSFQSQQSALDTRAEFWQQQKPIYARVRERRLRQQKWVREKKPKPAEVARYIVKSMEDIDMLLTGDCPKESCKKAERVLKTIEGWSEDEVPNKKELIGNLHSCIGNAQFEMGRMEAALKSHKMDLEFARQNNLPDAVSRALDNIGRVYARTGKFQQAIDTWEEKIPLAKSSLEKTWLFHEVGRCYLELGKAEEAQNYGEKSLQSAMEEGDAEWQLHASVLLAQAQEKLKDYRSAITNFEKALEKAKLVHSDAAQKAIIAALDDVSRSFIEDLKEREREKEARASKDHDFSGENAEEDNSEGQESEQSSESQRGEKEDAESEKEQGNEREELSEQDEKEESKEERSEREEEESEREEEESKGEEEESERKEGSEREEEERKGEEEENERKEGSEREEEEIGDDEKERFDFLSG